MVTIGGNVIVAMKKSKILNTADNGLMDKFGKFCLGNDTI